MATGSRTSLATLAVESTTPGRVDRGNGGNARAEFGVMIQPRSSAPLCICCSIAASLPSWPAGKTEIDRRPFVSALRASPTLSAGVVPGCPGGVTMPRRKVRVSCARTSDGRGEREGCAGGKRRQGRFCGKMSWKILWLVRCGYRAKKVESEGMSDRSTSMRQETKKKGSVTRNICRALRRSPAATKKAEPDGRERKPSTRLRTTTTPEMDRVDAVDLGRDRRRMGHGHDEPGGARRSPCR